MWSDDPLKDFMTEDALETRRRSKLPVCAFCGEPIQQESAVFYNNQWFCEDCEDVVFDAVRKELLKDVEDA